MMEATIGDTRDVEICKAIFVKVACANGQGFSSFFNTNLLGYVFE
jgi:hypothetical protein